MREEVIGLLEDLLPLVNLESEFLFSELSSLDITTIMLVLSEHYKVELSHEDVTPISKTSIPSSLLSGASKSKPQWRQYWTMFDAAQRRIRKRLP